MLFTSTSCLFVPIHLSLDAIEALLGEDFFAQAVECCINLDEGWGLAEEVLRILRP